MFDIGRSQLAIVIVACVIALAKPATAGTRTLGGQGSAEAFTLVDATRTADRSFIVKTLQQANAQLALARLALDAGNVRETRNVALQAESLWNFVQDRFSDVATQLDISTSIRPSAPQLAVLARLKRLSPSSFDMAYREAALQSCEATLQRMDGVDPLISPQILLVVDEVLPKFETMQVRLRGERDYLVGLMFVHEFALISAAGQSRRFRRFDNVVTTGSL